MLFRSLGPGGAAGPGGGAGPKKNAFEDQPKEVRNARRILQQRLERIHYGLTGTGGAKKPGTPQAEPKGGLNTLVDDAVKSKLMKVVTTIEDLQASLNKESLTSISLVKSTTRKPIFDLKKAVSDIIGDDGSTTVAPPEEPAGDRPVDDGFGGGN